LLLKLQSKLGSKLTLLLLFRTGEKMQWGCCCFIVIVVVVVVAAAVII